MATTCPKCKYTRTELDTAPDWQCPNCGVAYAKAAAAAAVADAPGAFVKEVVAATTKGSSPMSFGESVAYCLKNYVKFSGRASRSEYWWFTLFFWGLVTIVSFINDSLGGLVVLGLLLPNLGVGVRRLHDINRSGWWLLIGLLPLIGPILLLVWAVMPGTDGGNDYDE